MCADKVYLSLCEDVLLNGKARQDRTGLGTVSVFGRQIEFDLRDGFPLLTTKRVAWKSVLRELRWFLSGDTNSKTLEGLGVPIWKGNSTKEFLASRNLDYPEGIIGPGYSHQYRSWGAKYDVKEVASGITSFHRHQGIDQVGQLLDNIHRDPFSRRHLVSAWNVSQLHEMALPPCHITYQINVEPFDNDSAASDDGGRVSADEAPKGWMDLMWNQRSADVALGLPFNIASYALLLTMIAHCTGYKPRRLIGSLGDVHIYNGHQEGIRLQATREALPYPVVSIASDAPKRIECIEEHHIQLTDYVSHPPIKFEMAV